MRQIGQDVLNYDRTSKQTEICTFYKDKKDNKTSDNSKLNPGKVVLDVSNFFSSNSFKMFEIFKMVNYGYSILGLKLFFTVQKII